MKIEAVRVQNYKSVLDSGWVDIEDDFTTLVGANEAGKTNFLEVLSRFKTGKEISDAELSRYREEYPEKSEVPITSIRVSELPDTLFGSIQYANRSRSNVRIRTKSKIPVEVTRFADGSVRLPTDYLSKYIVSSDDTMDLEDAFLDKIQYTVSRNKRGKSYELRIEDEIRAKNLDQDTATELIKELNLDIGEFDTSSEQDLEKIREYSILSNVRSYLRAIAQTKEACKLAPDELSAFPSFRLFENIEPIPESAKRDELNSGNPYFELLQAIEMDSESLEGSSLYTSLTKRDSINEQITDQFNNNWKQANVRFKIQSINGEVTLRIFEEDDTGNEVKTLPSERSQGFRWYLSFFCHLIARGDGEIENSVILLDDPGAYLHPEGHKDLKDALSALAKDNQVLYSTHSPYMIDKNSLNSVRLVRHNREDDSDDETDSQEQDDEEETPGTNVTRLRGADSPLDDSLEAVRMALGASFSDSLFASKNTILVEGKDDRIYLQRMSELLGDDEPLLDEDVNFIDCGGATNADYLARIVDSEDYNAAVLLDDDKQGRNAREQLDDDLEVGVHHTGEYVDIDDRTTIEDLFSDDLICEVAADVHSQATEEQFKGRANPDHGEIADKLNGVLKGVIDDENPPKWVLDKLEVARTIDIRAEKEGKDMFEQETLDRFRELIEDVNSSLDSSEASENASEAEATATDD